MKLKDMIGSMASKFAALALALVCAGNVWGANVAKIGDTAYATLAAAVEAASAGQTVVVLQNVTPTETLTIDKSITLDLDGHTIDSSATSAANPTISVTNGTVTITGDGTVNGYGWAAIVEQDGVLTIENGTYQTIADSWVIGCDTGATLNFNNGTSTFIWTAGSTTISDGTITGRVYVGGGTTTINGGTFNTSGQSLQCADGSLVVNAGSFACNASNPVIYATGGTITVNGGTFSGGYGIYGRGGTVNVTDGTFTGGSYGIYNYGTTFNISGGSFTGGTASSGRAFYQYKGTTTISGGTFSSTQAAVVRYTGTITVSGGTFSASVADFVKSGYAQLESGSNYVVVPQTISLDISSTNVAVGGTATITATLTEDGSATWASSDTDKVTVENGTVTGVANGYALITATAPNGTTAKCMVTVGAVAKIGETEYGTLAEAFAAANESETEVTITLIADTAIYGNTGVTLNAGKTATLDLNGHVVSQTQPDYAAAYLIKNEGTLTIKDSSDTNADGTGSGKLTCYAEKPDTSTMPSKATNLITNNGTLTIESGEYAVTTSTGTASYAVDNYSGSTVNITGGKLTVVAPNSYVIRQFLNSTTADNTLNISGGIISGTYGVWMQFVNSNANKGTLNISDGTITATDGHAVYAGAASGSTTRNASEVSVSISGGTITGPTGSGAWFGSDVAYESIEVTGGTFSALGASAQNENFVSGGTFDSTALFTAGGRTDADTILANGYELTTNEQGKYVLEYREAMVITDDGATTNKYETLSAAWTAATNATTATVVMLADVSITNNTGYAVAVGQDITFDLNGCVISQVQTNAASGCLILNQGTLTLKDSSDTEKDGSGTGKLYCMAIDTSNSTSPYSPSWANNLITNKGTLSIESGYYDCYGAGAACYVVDNMSTASNAKLTVNGGKLEITNEDGSCAIRIYAQSETYTNDVTVNGGVIIGIDGGIWIQQPTKDKAYNATLTVTDGTISGHNAGAISMWCFNNAFSLNEFSNTTVTVTGGKFSSDYAWDYTYSKWPISLHPVSGQTDSCESVVNVSGGIWDKGPDSQFLADGYVVVANTDAATKDAYPHTIAPAVAQIDATYYATLDEAVAAAQAGDTITMLVDEIELTSTIEIDKDLTINLGSSCDIIATDCRAFWVKAGSFTLTGLGIIRLDQLLDENDDPVQMTLADSSSVIRVGSDTATTSFTLGESVYVTSDYCYGITYFGAKKQTVVIDGTVEVFGNQAALSGNGSAAYNTAEGGSDVTVNGFVKSSETYAIYSPETGTLTINGWVEGTGGVEVKAGTVVVGEDANITSYVEDEEDLAHTTNNNGTSTTGYAIAAVCNANYAGEPTVTIEEGATIEGFTIALAEANASAIGTVTAKSNALQIPAGYKWVETEGVYELEACAYVAQIGETKYESLAAAVMAAQDGDTVELIADCAVSEQVSVSKSINIDGNGFTVTSGDDWTGDYVFYVMEEATATAPISCNVSDLKIVSTKHQVVFLLNENENVGNVLNLNNVDIVCDGECIYSNGRATVNAEDCEFKREGVYATGKDNVYYSALVVGYSGVINATNCVVTSFGNGASTFPSGGKITFVGTEISVTPVEGIPNSGYALWARNEDYDNPAYAEYLSDSVIEVESGIIRGELKITDKYDSGDENKYAPIIAISGGYFSSAVSADYCATGYLCTTVPVANGYYQVVLAATVMFSKGEEADVTEFVCESMAYPSGNPALTALPKPTYTSTVKTFAGWKVSGEGDAIAALPAGTTSNITLVATWTVAQTIEVTTTNEQSTVAIKVTEDWIAANVTNKTDSAESPTATDIQEALNETADNGLKVWENYVIGQDPNTAVAVGAEQGAEITAMPVSNTLSVQPVDTGFTVEYSLKQVDTNGTTVATIETKPTTDFDIDLSKVSSNAYYVMTATIKTDAGAMVSTVTSTNTIGVLKVESSAKSTVIAVPWESLAADGQDITVSDLVRTATLSEGDELKVYDTATGKYRAWTLNESKEWEPMTVVGGASSEEAGDSTIARGSGVWLTRTDTTQPIYLVGEVAAEKAEVRLEAGSTDAPSWNLVGSTTVEPVSVTELLGAEGNDDGDKIVVPTAYVPKEYVYVDGQWGYYDSIVDEATIPGLKLVKQLFVPADGDDDKIPAGTGFWYLNGSEKSDKTIEL